jgi:hypothetical protein
VYELPLRRLAAALALLGAASIASACAIADLISSGKDCKTACNNLNTCGLIQTSDCGAYCAGLESSAIIMGCSSEFADQNSCGAANMDCTTAMQMCADQTTALTQCVQTYCQNNPGGNGCPLGGGDGGVDGG